MNDYTRTHKNEDSISSIFPPALDHLLVFILRSIGVYGKERPRTVTEVMFSMQWLIRRRLRMVAVVICYSIDIYEVSE